MPRLPLLPLAAVALLLALGACSSVGWRSQWANLCVETDWQDFRAAEGADQEELDSGVYTAVLDRFATKRRGSIELDRIATDFPKRGGDLQLIWETPLSKKVEKAFVEPTQANTPAAVRHHRSVKLGSPDTGPTADGVVRLTLSDPVYCKCGHHAAVAVSAVRGRRNIQSAILLGRARLEWMIVGRDEFNTAAAVGEVRVEESFLDKALRGNR